MCLSSPSTTTWLDVRAKGKSRTSYLTRIRNAFFLKRIASILAFFLSATRFYSSFELPKCLQLLKPAFTIICDKNSKCFLLLIRGTHSIKDTLTAATGAVVPFHHSVLHHGGISNLILGYAHCGMVAAARWIAKMSTPFLIKVLAESPDYKVKVFLLSL